MKENMHVLKGEFVDDLQNSGVFIFGYLSFTSSTQTLSGKWMVSRCLSS